MSEKLPTSHPGVYEQAVKAFNDSERPIERNVREWWGLYWLAAVLLAAPLGFVAGERVGFAYIVALWIGFSLGYRWPGRGDSGLFRLRRGGRA